MALTVRSIVLLAAVCAAGSFCKQSSQVVQERAPEQDAGSSAVLEDATRAVPLSESEDSAVAHEQEPVVADAAADAVLTIRVINAASRPVPFFINPDINEMIHTRKLRSRRAREDGGRDSDPVKFFPVGQMPMCASDAGAGYGGLGQPERRELQPNEVLEFVWDGLERREVLHPGRGVCLEVGPPQPGRYRFEIDQPRRTLRCDDGEFSYPLREGAPRVIEIRCRIRTSADDHGSVDEG